MTNTLYVHENWEREMIAGKQNVVPSICSCAIRDPRHARHVQTGARASQSTLLMNVL
jgi:hypothetical protein